MYPLNMNAKLPMSLVAALFWAGSAAFAQITSDNEWRYGPYDKLMPTGVPKWMEIPERRMLVITNLAPSVTGEAKIILKKPLLFPLRSNPPGNVDLPAPGLRLEPLPVNPNSHNRPPTLVFELRPRE